MRDRDPKKLNKDDLAEVKSLIGDAEPGSFTLEDILAEYGGRKGPRRSAVPVSVRPQGGEEAEGPDLPWPEAPRRAHPRDNVVAFPGGHAVPEERLEEEPEEDGPEEESGEAGPEETGEEEAPNDRVVEFPEEESVLSSFLKDLTQRADDYADHMFQESESMDQEEIRRLEQLIPGTDVEEDEPEEAPSRFRRPRIPPPRSWPAATARGSRGCACGRCWCSCWLLPPWCS